MSGIEVRDQQGQIDRIEKRLYELDQRLFSSTGGGSNRFGSIIIDDGSGNPVTIKLITPTPTGLVAAWTAVLDHIYIDVSWTSSVPGTTYQVEWAKKPNPLADPLGYVIENVASGLGGNSYRIDDVDPDTTYGVRLYASAPGTNIPSSPTDWFDVAVGKDGTIPASPEGAAMIAGFHSIQFQWTPNEELDMVGGKGRYRMQLFSNAGRTALVNEKTTTASVDSFDGLATGTQYWGRVYAIDSSGNQSPPVDLGPVTTTKIVTIDYTPSSVDFSVLADLAVVAGKIAAGAVVAGKIAAGAVNDPVIFTDQVVGRAAIALAAIGTAQIENLAVIGAKIDNATIDDAKIIRLDAAKVNFGQMSGDRISANTADVAILKSSSLTTQTITLAGGAFRALGSGGGVGMLVNSQGASFYDNGGTRTIFFDASNGAGAFTGTITATGGTLGNLTVVGTLTGGNIVGATITGGVVRTAASGPRVVLDSANSSFLDFYAIGNEYDPGHIFVDNNAAVVGETRIFMRSGQPVSGDHYAQIYLITTFGASTALVEGDSILLRAPGPTDAVSIENHGPLNCYGEIRMRSFVFRFKDGADTDNRMIWSATAGSPFNGTQNVDGPVINGHAGVGLGGNPSYGIGFRVFCDGSTFRNDSYSQLYCLQGLSTSGSKTFEIDHPVKGKEYYLTFSSIEGPRADLMYRGVTTLNSRGVANIDLDTFFGMTPGTFDKLNFAENRQALAWQEGGGGASLTWSLKGAILTVQGPSGLEVGWMVITERGDDSMMNMINTDRQGHIVNERRKTEFEEVSDNRQRPPKP